MHQSHELIEHYFRSEYGRMVAYFTRYLGTGHIQKAEDIVQETMLKALVHWQQEGIPPNPQAWLYTSAKNHLINFLKKEQRSISITTFKIPFPNNEIPENHLLDEKLMADDLLKMMFVCCHQSLSEKSQIILIMKTLCGFSIDEIAKAFFTSKDTINKILVRGRAKLRTNKVGFELPRNLEQRFPVVVKTLYLLFNEGYSPTRKEVTVRFDLCLEAIRLCKLLIESDVAIDKSDCRALLALMYLNASRFHSRVNSINMMIGLDEQARDKWDQDLINKGLLELN